MTVPHIWTLWPLIKPNLTFVHLIHIETCYTYLSPFTTPFSGCFAFPHSFNLCTWCGVVLWCVFLYFHRNTFSVDPDTHIDSIEQAEEIVLEGTSKWSCKIAITGIMACRDRDHATTTCLIKAQSKSMRQKKSWNLHFFIYHFKWK